ncbi:Methylated-DNA-(protein)-cysteine S-methyltransferase DNA binding [Paenibacillus curdlanolyticus YK9]|uniref:Methylated-DNA-(Protein)-cysteine S-methyltransferase DNA binding n=1 Tax=Paenibacillus curdlanolyticus YK9 TaxID=717606 RepID=E0IG44_9BACL|nr:MGMT family protein [Paenibacillus curdlanolyticus]EFM08624.1 Methylated-DNA-(protein)-cysteine S-methyltransferase DNA binding [Paenibacillus curdlanolyticus YK9]
MEPFTLRVIEIIKGIPAGRVMTYGQIAASAGSPRAARQVVRLLHSLSMKHGLPWHRVVNAKGEIAIQDVEGRDTQLFLLEQEGIVCAFGRIDLDKFRYEGPLHREEDEE